MTLTLGVPKETLPGEQRVAFVPSLVPVFSKGGFSVLREAGAGRADSGLTSQGAFKLDIES